jgi:hypothetical protein
MLVASINIRLASCNNTCRRLLHFWQWYPCVYTRITWDLQVNAEKIFSIPLAVNLNMKLSLSFLNVSCMKMFLAWEFARQWNEQSNPLSIQCEWQFSDWSFCHQHRTCAFETPFRVCTDTQKSVWINLYFVTPKCLLLQISARSIPGQNKKSKW